MQWKSTALLPIAISLAFAFTSSASSDPSRLPRSLKRLPGRTSPSPPTPLGDKDPKPAQDYHVVSKDVLNLRSIMEGGRKLIRHDCDSQDALEAIFTKDVGFPSASLHTALSVDEGVTWDPAGPLGQDPGLPERDHSIAFDGGLTHLSYVEGDSLFFAADIYQCMATFPRFAAISDDTHFYLSPQVVFEPPSTIYLSVFAPLTGNTYFTKTTDDGATWGPMVRMNDAGAQGFDMKGFDGPLAMDADSEFLAALAMVLLDPEWASANGFLSNVSYPAYTQTTDGGETWAPLRLLWGNDGSRYPHGHSGDPVFDEQIHYIGGVQEVGYTSVGDNVAVTVDGMVHLAYTMTDTTFGYMGVFHTRVGNDSLSSAYIGFPEDPELSGESGVAYMPGIGQSDGELFTASVVVGWTEFVQPTGMGDICYAVILPGQAEQMWGPLNVTNTPTDDETYQRIVDRLRTGISGELHELFIDWVFLYYGDGGSARDSTLWHLQTVFSLAGIEDGGAGGGPLPRAASLSQNYPNPFNPTTTITYSLEAQSRVSIEIRDVRGRLVRKLEEGIGETGTHRVTWDGRGDRGEPLPSGVYLYRLRTDRGVSAVRKMIMLR